MGPDNEPGSNPFEGIPFMGDFMKLIGNQGQIWDSAAQMANGLASGTEPEANVDPAVRVQVEALTRVAEMNISSILRLDFSGVKLVPVVKSRLVAEAMNAYKPYFEALKDSYLLASEEDLEQGIAELGKFLTPILTMVSAGSLVGNLVADAFGSYELLAPRANRDNPEVLLAEKNIKEFAAAWSLPEDSFWVWVCLSELSKHAVMNSKNFHSAISELISEYAGGFEPASKNMLDRFGEELADVQEYGEGQDFPDLGGVMDIMKEEPELMFGLQVSDAQMDTIKRLDTLMAVVMGLSQYALKASALKVLGDQSLIAQIQGAMDRNHAGNTSALHLASRLFGINQTPELQNLGVKFIDGVVDRAGPEAIQRIFESSKILPTEAEVEAPGLWLARIDLPD